MISCRVTVDLTPVENLKKTLVNKIMRDAMKQAIKPVLTTVKGNASIVRRYGYLQKSFAQKIRIYKGTIVGIVGPKSNYSVERGVRTRGRNKGKPIRIQPSHYLHFLEGGTVRVSPRPVLTPALQQTQDQYRDIFTRKVAEGIDRALSSA